ncbi:hypothetical protein GOQ30_18385 [Flavobacterium sp. TP390]|uniref:RDD domain-containing protein n=1 Tax=Flavobacterium profundi TaxID=1774945 RepID=A0A6I4IVY5_9FLAO|nr:RDD family protein [Flavobacterium profundi]MVO11139.1 hypothetical protein [Flavobacterium profundi]
MNDTEYKGVLHKEVNKLSRINPRFHRISSMLLDHILMCIFIVPIMFIPMILMISGILEFENRTFSIIFFFLIFIYLNKDFFNAKSPAKRLLGYQIINRKTGKAANELECFVRNLTIAIGWPLEVIVALYNPERRIGDFLANTKVVNSEKEKLKTIWSDFKNKTLKLNFIAILIIGIIYFYGLNLLMPKVY